jgi:hypothetical protein
MPFGDSSLRELMEQHANGKIERRIVLTNDSRRRSRSRDPERSWNPADSQRHLVVLPRKSARDRRLSRDALAEVLFSARCDGNRLAVNRVVRYISTIMINAFSQQLLNKAYLFFRENSFKPIYLALGKL